VLVYDDVAKAVTFGSSKCAKSERSVWTAASILGSLSEVARTVKPIYAIGATSFCASTHQDDQGKPKTLNAWFHDYLIELKNEGIDINAATRRQDKIGWGCMLAGLGLCFVAASVIALAIVGLQAIYRR
jgi:hypothetical protein